MRSETPAIFTFAFVFLFGSLFSSWFSELINKNSINLLAIFFFIGFLCLMVLGIFLLIFNKSKLIELSEKLISFHYGLPLARKSITIPLDNFNSVEISESPREFLFWPKLAPPMKYKEGHKVIKISFVSSLPNNVIEEIKKIKRKAFTPPMLFANANGTELFIRAELKGGYACFIEQLKKHSNTYQAPVGQTESSRVQGYTLTR